ncbi:MAG: NAD-dependent epimerase/dehydratase family protein, partial [Candidatus Dormiibacterota bacterium]
MTRAVVSGGAGFIGSHLCQRLIAEGWDVVALDNLITGDAANVRHLHSSKHFTLLEQDVTEPIVLAGHVDAVLHF